MKAKPKALSKVTIKKNFKVDSKTTKHKDSNVHIWFQFGTPCEFPKFTSRGQISFMVRSSSKPELGNTWRDSKSGTINKDSFKSDTSDSSEESGCFTSFTLDKVFLKYVN